MESQAAAETDKATQHLESATATSKYENINGVYS